MHPETRTPFAFNNAMPSLEENKYMFFLKRYQNLKNKWLSEKQE